MKHSDLGEAAEVERREFVCLTELWDLTAQLSEAVDRNDQVSVQMVLAMRQEPVTRLQELDTLLRERLQTLPQERAIRLNALLNGGPAEEPEEEALCEQVARNGRLLRKIVEVDRRVSIRLGGKRSIYKLYREPAGDA